MIVRVRAALGSSAHASGGYFSQYRGVSKKSIVGELEFLECEVIDVKTVYRLQSSYHPGVVI